ncbi:MAG: HAD family hydrolase [Verrucomicrobiota bacterium]
MRPPLLLLFDIDGTLLDSGGLGLISLEEGMIDAFQLEGRRQEMPVLDLAGATDASVMRQLFAAFGVEDHAEHREKFLRSYEARLRHHLTASHERVTCLPGVRPLLHYLGTRTEHLLALLTGNAERGAQAKLAAIGMESYFEFGAYGTDRETRDELGWVALERARERGWKGDPDDMVIIGDTPKDVACARAVGARVLAVATGSFSVSELEEAGADHVVRSLEGEESRRWLMNE